MLNDTQSNGKKGYASSIVEKVKVWFGNDGFLLEKMALTIQILICTTYIVLKLFITFK